MSNQDSLSLEFASSERPEFRENTIFHVGVSGGKDSSAVLLWMIHESGIDRSKIQATFCDIGNDHEWTLEHVKYLSQHVHPIETIYPKRNFFDLAMYNKRFPAPAARFCTRELKIIPAADHATRLFAKGYHVIAVSGVRADESESRKNLTEWDYSGTMLCLQWRPLIKWTIQDVYAIHEKYGVPLNPLYAAGAERVGCWPCIMSRKAEIRNIALNFPHRIDQIRAAEEAMFAAGRQYAGFFSPGKIPERFQTGQCKNKAGEDVTYPTIDDVVRWSMTGKGAEGSWEDDPDEDHPCQSGFCE